MSEFEEAKAFLQKDENGTNLVGEEVGRGAGAGAGGLAQGLAGSIVSGRLTDV